MKQSIQLITQILNNIILTLSKIFNNCLKQLLSDIDITNSNKFL